MTAKRFKSINCGLQGQYIKNEEIILTIDEVVELLNELHEENENLKDLNVQCCNDYSAMRRDVLRYKEENEQLQHDATILIQSNQDYRKENEELKQQLRDCEKFRHAVYQEISKEMSKHD